MLNAFVFFNTFLEPKITDDAAHGVVHGKDGSCTCRNDWSGTRCEVCESGHAGNDCQYSDQVDCNSNGQGKETLENGTLKD